MSIDPGRLPSHFIPVPLDAEPGAVNVRAAARPRPGSSLIASAQRITSSKLADPKGQKPVGGQRWQTDAWNTYDLVGEQRFLATTIASRMAQARIFVGRRSDTALEEIEPLEDAPAISSILDSLSATGSALPQMVYRLGVNLFVAGEGWIVGIPRHLLPAEAAPAPDEARAPVQALDVAMTDLVWHVISSSELRSLGDGRLVIALPDGTQVETTADESYLIRVWRPHPRYAREADSPTRSSLPVLRELIGLTKHVSAQVDSRLAGAGLLLVPESASRAMRARLGVAEDDEDDPFVESLISAMTTPINDRSSAAAVVPLVVTVPDESSTYFKHISFASPLDSETRELRDEAIHRLAIGQDAPPELLLGVGGMNHWGAWLVREDVVTTHLEPPLALICDALTSQYLHPMLRAQGLSEDEVLEYVVWYDVDHLVVRPSRGADAERLYDKGVISDRALRDAAGFEEGDAPESSTLDEAGQLALEMVRANPSLMQNPGLDKLLSQLRALIAGHPEAALEVTAPIADPARRRSGSTPSAPAPETGPPSTSPEG